MLRSDFRAPQSFKEKDLNRSVFNLNQAKIGTFMQCLNFPYKFEKMQPKDEFTIDHKSMIESLPLDGQMKNDWRLRIQLFKSSLSNYYSWMDNNARITQNEFKNRRHHTISSQSLDSIMDKLFARLYPDLAQYVTGTGNMMSNWWLLTNVCSVFGANTDGQGSPAYINYDTARTHFGVQPHSLLDMVEFPVTFYQSDDFQRNSEKPTQNFNADYILCYLDAIRNWLVNNQLDSVPYLVNLPNYGIGSAGSPVLEPKPGKTVRIFDLKLSSIDKFFKYLRMEENGIDLVTFISKSIFTQEEKLDLGMWLSSLRYGGLFLAQYERDMLNSLLRTAGAEDISITVDSETGTFNVNQLRLANRKQLRSDRFGVSGGRWKNLLRSVWGSDVTTNMDIPELVNSTSYYINAQSVMSNANTEDGNGNGASLGQLAAVYNTRSLKDNKIRVYSEDYSIFFAIVSLVPDVVYCNGLGKGLDTIYFDDEYYPQFDQLGFQDVPRYKYNALPVYDPFTGNYNPNSSTFLNVVGKNIAFIDMISNVDRCHGNFAKDAFFESWVLKRRFEHDYIDTNGDVGSYPMPDVDITSYANPLEYQYPFVMRDGEDANFIFQISFDIRAVRTKGKYFMPTLGK